MKRSSVPFSPLHGMASLGAGGLSVSFFVWLLFLTPHKGTPVPTYESLLAARLAQPDTGWITLVTTMVAIMAVAHYGLLIWWLRRGVRLPIAERDALFAGEAHIFKMITPLVLAMSVNAGFVVALVFVPGLWSIKEYLFPFALLAFGALFVVALDRWLEQQKRLRTDQLSYQSKGLIELLATFAFAMITVGFSAAAAMSELPITHSIGMVLAVIGATVSIWAAIKVFKDRRCTLRNHPTAATATGSLLMGVPILTVLGIATYRLLMASHHNFGLQISTELIGITLGLLFIGQVLIFLVATPKLVRLGGWQTLVRALPQGASFSLICPGVGLFVLGMFFVSKGLIPMGFLGSHAATVAYALLGFLQLLTLALFVYFLLYAMPGRARERKQAKTRAAMV